MQVFIIGERELRLDDNSVHLGGGHVPAYRSENILSLVRVLVDFEKQPMHNNVVVVVVVCCCVLLCVVVGCCWLLLLLVVGVGCCWLLLVVVGCCW